jgi:hypothetical protein
MKITIADVLTTITWIVGMVLIIFTNKDIAGAVLVFVSMATMIFGRS